MHGHKESNKDLNLKIVCVCVRACVRVCVSGLRVCPANKNFNV